MMFLSSEIILKRTVALRVTSAVTSRLTLKDLLKSVVTVAFVTERDFR